MEKSKRERQATTKDDISPVMDPAKDIAGHLAYNILTMDTADEVLKQNVGDAGKTWTEPEKAHIKNEIETKLAQPKIDVPMSVNQEMSVTVKRARIGTSYDMVEYKVVADSGKNLAAIRIVIDKQKRIDITFGVQKPEHTGVVEVRNVTAKHKMMITVRQSDGKIGQQVEEW